MNPTNPTNLGLVTTLPVIALQDYEGLKNWALKVRDDYKCLVILEEQATGAKAEIAELRRIAKQLDSSRIAAVKQVSDPIRDFEAQIKEVAGIFLETADGIDSQVKNYEEQAREIKRAEVLFAIETLTTEAGYPGLEIPVQESWTNKTSKPKAVAAGIQAEILRHIQAEKATAAAEQAKLDRAVAIEGQNTALAQGYGFTLQVSSFYKLHDLDLPLVHVHDAMSAAYKLKAEENMRVAAQTVAAPAPALDAFGRRPLDAPAAQAMPNPAPGRETQPQAPLGFRKGMTIAIGYEAHREAEVLEALRVLRTLCATMTTYKGEYDLSMTPSDQRQAQAQRPVQRPY